MLSFVGFGFIYVVCGLIVGDVTAATVEDLKEEYTDIMIECIAENPITTKDLESLQKKKLPDSKNVKCLFACAFKKTGMTDEKGNLLIEGVREVSQKYMAADPEMMKRSEEFIEACKDVNDMTFSDDDKGCEKAAWLYECSVKNAPDAMTEDELKEEFMKIIMKCTKDHPVEMTELVQLQQLTVPKNMETKCLLACAYKLEGTMNAKGLYDVEHAYEIAELTKNGDEKRLVNGKKLADLCVKVNDVEVSDGEKGCERAGLILECTVENAPKLGFKI